jgi:hypothetical protein
MFSFKITTLKIYQTDLVLMIPKYISRWLRTESDTAREVYGAAHINVQIRPSQDGRGGH